MIKRKAVIDIGTNSIKFCIAEAEGDSFQIIKDDTDIARLGEGLNENGIINDKALKRNSAAIKKFVDISREYDADISAIGTMALRNARNAHSFISFVKKNCGVDIRIISGEEEAKLAFEAASGLSKSEPCAVFDTGGGSTELIRGEADEKQSINLGSVRIKERYFNTDLAVDSNSLNSAYTEINESLKSFSLTADAVLIGIGGAVTTIASVKLGLARYDEKAVNGLIISIDDMESQIKMYAGTTLKERILIPGLHPKRADIILAGCCIVRSLMKFLKKQSFIVSARGIRHAIIANYFKSL